MGKTIIRAKHNKRKGGIVLTIGGSRTAICLSVHRIIQELADRESIGFDEFVDVIKGLHLLDALNRSKTDQQSVKNE